MYSSFTTEMFRVKQVLASDAVKSRGFFLMCLVESANRYSPRETE